MTAKAFHLGDILSVTTGWLVSPRLIDGVYDVVNHMTQDSIYTHQLPRACREVTPFILKQHPALAGIDASHVTSENWRAWLAEQVLLHGETLPLEPMPPGEHYEIDPVSELAEMVHPSKIIVVSPDKGPS